MSFPAAASAEARARRRFIAPDFEVTTWPLLAPHYQTLLHAPLDTLPELEQWLLHRSELSFVVDEEASRRYILTTINTRDTEAEARLHQFYEEILPEITRVSNQLDQRLAEAAERLGLDPHRYETLLRDVRNDLELFRDENVPIFTQIELKAQEFGKLTGEMTIDYEGQTYTLPQAAKFLQRPERDVRQDVWTRVSDRRMQDRETLDALFDTLLGLRQQVAHNAGFESFTDYSFRAMGRFDYSPAEAEAFHTGVEQVFRPLYQQLLAQRRKALGVDALRPWDLDINYLCPTPLRPFETGAELLQKTQEIFARVHPDFYHVLREMEALSQLDLESRVGKAPGGYNSSLQETGFPFIFMNAAGSQKDVRTMVHEAGHAFHSYYTARLPMAADRNFTSELAEVASMSMELVTLPHWDVFYSDPSELRTAQIEQLVGIIEIFPWIATVDCFQQWVYRNPAHTHAERADAFRDIYQRFHGQEVDWSGLEDHLRYRWHRQIHIFEYPFYYIEYGIAQLGALQVWRNYLQNPDKALAQYIAFLQAGYTRPMPEVFATGGMRFDFGPAMMTELADFLRVQLAARGFEI
jgi:oligoendopeptidase F